MRPSTCFVTLIGLFGCVFGCQAPPQPGGPTSIVLRIPDRERFIEAALTVLRENDFAPRRVDWQRGRVVAGPTTSAQWFEPWRIDPPDAYQRLESNLHTVQREVTLNVAPAADPPQDDEYEIAVQVDKFRYSAPDRQVTTAAGALAIYSERLPTTEGLRAARSAGEHWISLGRDGPLEALLLDRIAAALPAVRPVTRGAVAEPPEAAEPR